MVEERPLSERPAARPSAPAAPVQPLPAAEAPPKSGGLGCFGVVGIVTGALIVIAVIIGAIAAGNHGNSSGGSSSGGSGNSADPIEQARTVLSVNFGESYTYADVKSATDTALSATGESVNNDMRSRSWSAVLAIVKAPELAAVSPMGIMRCVGGEGAGSENAGMGFAEVAAICAVLMK